MAHSTPHPSAGFVSPSLSGRSIVLLAIVALHVLFAYLLASGLGSTVIQVLAGTTEATFTDENPVERPVPPPVPVDFVPPQVESVTPDIVINDPVPDDDLIKVPPPGPTDTKTVVRETPALPPIRLVGKHQIPNAEGYYPASEIRAGVEGAAIVHVCADERGRPQGTPIIENSSGSAKLDTAALEMIRDGKYARAMRGEEYVPNCYNFRIVFQIRK